MKNSSLSLRLYLHRLAMIRCAVFLFAAYAANFPVLSQAGETGDYRKRLVDYDIRLHIKQDVSVHILYDTFYCNAQGLQEDVSETYNMKFRQRAAANDATILLANDANTSYEFDLVDEEVVFTVGVVGDVRGSEPFEVKAKDLTDDKPFHGVSDSFMKQHQGKIVTFWSKTGVITDDNSNSNIFLHSLISKTLMCQVKVSYFVRLHIKKGVTVDFHEPHFLTNAYYFKTDLSNSFVEMEYRLENLNVQDLGANDANTPYEFDLVNEEVVFTVDVVGDDQGNETFEVKAKDLTGDKPFHGVYDSLVQQHPRKIVTLWDETGCIAGDNSDSNRFLRSLLISKTLMCKVKKKPQWFSCFGRRRLRGGNCTEEQKGKDVTKVALVIVGLLLLMGVLVAIGVIVRRRFQSKDKTEIEMGETEIAMGPTIDYPPALVGLGHADDVILDDSEFA